MDWNIWNTTLLPHHLFLFFFPQPGLYSVDVFVPFGCKWEIAEVTEMSAPHRLRAKLDAIPSYNTNYQNAYDTRRVCAASTRLPLLQSSRDGDWKTLQTPLCPEPILSFEHKHNLWHTRTVLCCTITVWKQLCVLAELCLVWNTHVVSIPANLVWLRPLLELTSEGIED